MGDTSKEDGLSVDGLAQKSIGGDDGNPAKAISSAPKPPEVDRSAVVPPTPEVSVSEVDINKMKPTTSAVLSDKIALSQGDHPDTSVSDLDASKKVIPSTKALIVASAEGVVPSHKDESSEMKPASPGSSLPPDMALSAEETTAPRWHWMVVMPARRRIARLIKHPKVSHFQVSQFQVSQF